MEKKGGKRLAGAKKEYTPAELAPAESTPVEEHTPVEDTPAEASAQPMSRGRRLWKDYGYMVITLAVVFVLFKVLLQLAYVPSGSMETTIPTKTLLIGWRLPYVVSAPVPDRGDIVTFWDDEMNKVLVKRVIGLPGETVSFRDGYTYINGEKLDESYLPTQGVTNSDRSFTVPDGCIFVMGDNRTGSNDSRSLSEPYIPVSNIQGRMLVAISIGREQSWQGVRWIA